MFFGVGGDLEDDPEGHASGGQRGGARTRFESGRGVSPD